MLLEIETKRVGPDVVVVELAGRITLGDESRSLENLVTDLMGKNERKVIFNLARVDYIDSTGIGTITLCFSNLKKAAGGLRIAGAGGKVWQQFKMTRLDTVLTFYPTVEEACGTWL